MLRRSTSPLLATLTVPALAVLLVPALARAQAAPSIAITNKAVLERWDGNNQSVRKRERQNPEGINLNDCRQDLKIVFPLVMSGITTGDSVEVWTTENGANCSTGSVRSDTAKSCTKLAVNIPVLANTTVALPIKTLIKGQAAEVDADGCRRVRAGIDVQFLYFRSGASTGDATTKDNATIQVKTTPPAPLSGVRARPGNNGITIEWTAVGGEGGVEDVAGVKAYCDLDPVPASSTAATSKQVCDDATTQTVPVDSGDGGDGGETTTVEVEGGCRTETVNGTNAGEVPKVGDGLSSDGKACTNQAFAPTSSGRIVPGASLANFECGSQDSVTSSSIRVTGNANGPLTNGHMTAVAIAATDSYGNVGELSDAVCQYPEATVNFWNEYRNAGGGAGGCATAAAPAGSLGVLGVLAAVAMSRVRRRLRTEKVGR